MEQLVKLGCWLWIRQSYCISFKFHKYGNLIVVMWGGHHNLINIYLVLMSNAGWCRQLTLMVQNKQFTYIFSYGNDKTIRAVWQNVKYGWVQTKGSCTPLAIFVLSLKLFLKQFNSCSAWKKYMFYDLGHLLLFLNVTKLFKILTTKSVLPLVYFFFFFNLNLFILIGG